MRIFSVEVLVVNSSSSFLKLGQAKLERKRSKQVKRVRSRLLSQGDVNLCSRDYGCDGALGP